MIIAEIGQNHCGNMDLAKRLIREAKDNGADLVKFQLYDHKQLYGDNPDIPNVELSFEQAKMLFDYGEEVGVEVFFSVFDAERVKWCEEIGVKRYKIAGTLQDSDTIKAVAKTGKPVISSRWEGVMCFWRDFPVLPAMLNCVNKYPASPSDYNLKEMKIYAGISDHTIGLDAPKIALARGAEIIEKHFATDHQTGVDAEWSMTPDELRELKEWEDTVQKVL